MGRNGPRLNTADASVRKKELVVQILRRGNQVPRKKVGVREVK